MDQRYMYTLLGVLRNVNWPHKSTKFTNYTSGESSGYVKVLRIDELSAPIRRILGESYVEIASNNINLSEKDIREHKSPGGHGIFTDRLLKGKDVFDTCVDPVLSQHFLVVYETGPMAKNGEASDRLSRYMADTLAAIRLATNFPVTIPFPLRIADSTHAGCLLVTGTHDELERFRDKYPVCVVSPATARQARTFFGAICESRKDLGFVVRKLNLAAMRQRPDEGFLEYMMALEALYCADTHNELSYRLRLRCATHIGTSKEKREKIYREIKDLYKMRSKIVHGNANTIEQAAKRTMFQNSPFDATERAREFLYSGLRRFLLDAKHGISGDERAATADKRALGVS